MAAGLAQEKSDEEEIWLTIRSVLTFTRVIVPFRNHHCLRVV